MLAKALKRADSPYDRMSPAVMGRIADILRQSAPANRLPHWHSIIECALAHTERLSTISVVRISALPTGEYTGLASRFSRTQAVIKEFGRVLEIPLRRIRCPLRLRFIPAISAPRFDTPHPSYPPAEFRDITTEMHPLVPAIFPGIGFVPYMGEQLPAQALLPYTVFFWHLDRSPLNAFPTKEIFRERRKPHAA